MKHAFFVAALFCFLLSCKAEDSENFQNLWFAADVYRIDDYPSRTKQNGQPFKIIQFADTQLEDDAAKIAVVFDIISQAINDSQPDMLVLTGDNVSGENNDTLGHRLISFLDTFNVPYALVMGNHDGEGRFDNAQMGMIFGSGKHSLFQMGPDNIHGTGNYAVNIKTQNNDVFYTLIMLDSNRYRTYADRNGYDYIYPDQIDWYAWMIQGVSAAANTVNGGGGGILPSITFFHIPLPEIYEIKTEIEAEHPEYAADAFREPPCPPEINTGMFAKIKELNSTKAVVFGHDHVNVLNYEYQGVQFVYGLKTGICSYYNADRIGYTLITIHNDQTIDVQFINYTLVSPSEASTAIY